MVIDGRNEGPHCWGLEFCAVSFTDWQEESRNIIIQITWWYALWIPGFILRIKIWVEEFKVICGFPFGIFILLLLKKLIQRLMVYKSVSITSALFILLYRRDRLVGCCSCRLRLVGQNSFYSMEEILIIKVSVKQLNGIHEIWLLHFAGY